MTVYHNSLRIIAVSWLSLFCLMAIAEPHFALETGQKCMACHTNITGGGKRTPYGNAFAQLNLPATTFPEEYWDGRVIDQLYLGGNVRASGSGTFVPNQDDEFEFDLDSARLYVELPLLKDRLTVYIDQEISPSSDNREAFALLFLRNRSIYLKAGSFYLPFGLRLEDDTEFVRQVGGINFNTPDDGLEAGLDLGRTSLRLAVTNGAGGAAEDDRGKQYSFLATYVHEFWRIGGSANYNDSGRDRRTMYGGFAGLKTGPLTWMGEVDFIDDEGLGPDGRDQWIGLAEINWMIRKGHYLKLTYGGFDPDDDVDENEQNRYSVVYEYIPIPFLQVRAGARFRDGIPQNDLQNTDFYFLQLNAFF